MHSFIFGYFAIRLLIVLLICFVLVFIGYNNYRYTIKKGGELFDTYKDILDQINRSSKNRYGGKS